VCHIRTRRKKVRRKEQKKGGFRSKYHEERECAKDGRTPDRAEHRERGCDVGKMDATVHTCAAPFLCHMVFVPFKVPRPVLHARGLRRPRLR
jgi:hypothetical protein